MQMKKEKNFNQLSFVFLAIAFLLVVLPSVSGAVAWVTPVTLANLTTSTTFNVSYENTTDITTPVSANTSVYWNGSGSWVAVPKNGLTCTATHCNGTLTLSSLTQAVNGYFNVSLGNNTDILAGTLLQATVDYTDPVCTVTRQSPKISYKGVQQLSWSVTDALSLVSNAEYVDGPQSQTTLSYSTAVNSVTLTSADTGYTGDWLVNVTGTDRSGNTCYAEATWASTVPGSAVTTTTTATSQKDYTSLIVIALIIVGIVVLAKRKK
jgi:hypothetical protein